MEVNEIPVQNIDVGFEGAQKQDIQLTKFIPFSVLVPELRHHILSYNDGSTLVNYAECSKLCNSEVQRFNTEPPKELRIIEETDGVLVKMAYVKYVEQGWPHRVEKNIDKKFIFSEDMMNEIQKYLMKYYKYVESKNTKYLGINVKQWPTDVMKMKCITNILEWIVTIYDSMCSDFIEYFKTIDVRDKHFHFFDCVEEVDRVVIPAAFFKSVGCRSSEALCVHQKCQIESEDFLNLNGSFIHLKSSISFDDIREKVRRWNNGIHLEKSLITIRLPEDDERVFDIVTIFPVDQFDIRPMRQERWFQEFKVGKVVVLISDVKELELSFEQD